MTDVINIELAWKNSQKSVKFYIEIKKLTLVNVWDGIRTRDGIFQLLNHVYIVWPGKTSVY